MEPARRGARSTTDTTILVALASTLLLACPAEIPPEDPPPGDKVVKLTNDPRVVELDGELYSKDSPSIAETVAPEPTKSLGTGVPDESNGQCRLYAPKLPDPRCCPDEYGFDEKSTREFCGLDVYLGESVRTSCGYFFTSTEVVRNRSFRVARIQGDTPQSAAEGHANRLARQLKKPLKAEAVPGVAGAWVVNHEDMHWGFLPGWEHIRQVSWNDNSCPSGRGYDVLATMAAARQPTPEETRPMTPVARASTPTGKTPSVPAGPAPGN